MKREGREPQYIASALNTPMVNYKVYYMNRKEKIQNVLLALIAGGATGLIFYGGQFKDEDGIATMATWISNVVIFLIVGIIAVSVYLPMKSKKLKEKRKAEITHQFRELLAALSASLSSGMNMLDSLTSAYKDLELEYSKKAYIVQEVREMIDGMNNNVPIEDMMSSFGERSEIDDIKNFGIVFSMCYRTGGSLKDIVRRTNDILSEKIEIKEEIETAIASNKMQFNVMMVFPVGMVLVLRTMSSAFSASFATTAGVIAMTVAMGIFVGAYKLGQAIMDVKG